VQVSPGLAVGKYVDSDEVRVVVVGSGVGSEVRDEVAAIGSRVGSSVLMGASVATAVGESVGFSVYSRCWLKTPRSSITVSTAVTRLGGVFRAVGPGCEPLW
jgi:hypothetical protein